jgi:hypothetical protein
VYHSDPPQFEFSSLYSLYMRSDVVSLLLLLPEWHEGRSELIEHPFVKDVRVLSCVVIGVRVAKLVRAERVAVVVHEQARRIREHQATVLTWLSGSKVRSDR